MSWLNRLNPLRLFRRASLENPTTSLSEADDWLYEALGGSPSTSGARVTRKTAMSYAALWRAVNLISRDVAKLPLFVIRRDGRRHERDPSHPAYALLRRKANSQTTSFRLKQVLTAHALSQGNGYAAIERDGSATPRKLLILLPDRVTPVRRNGVLWYVVQVGAETVRLPWTDVLHIKGLGYDGLSGYSVIEMARESLGLALAAREHAARYFGQGARPSVLLEHPGNISEAAANRLRASWDGMYSGLANHHKTAILEEGMSANLLSFSAKDSQLIESRKFDVREIANWFGVPPHKLGDDAKTSFASLEQENLSYVLDALDGWLVEWEHETWDKLLTEQEKRDETHDTEFERRALVRADLATRSSYYTTALGGAPFLTVNEVRSAESLNPIDGGDEISQPLNMTGGAGRQERAADSPTDPPGDPAADPPQRAIARRLLVDAIGRMARRLGVHARRATGAELDIEAHRAVIRAALAPVFEAAGAISGETFCVEGYVEALLGRAADVYRGAMENDEAKAALDRAFTTFEAEAPAAAASLLIPD